MIPARLNRIVIWLSMVVLIIFFINTYLYNFLFRDLFYSMGVYFPFTIIAIYVGYCIYLLVQGKRAHWINIMSVIGINLITIALYVFYMQQALIVK